MDSQGVPLKDRMDKDQTRAMRNRREFVVGICLLLVVVLLWTGSSFLTQGLFEDGYEKPFLVTYLNTSAFSVYLIPFLWKHWKRWRNRESVEIARGQYEAIPTETSPLAPLTPVSYRSRSLPPAVITHLATEQDLPPLTTKQTAELASVFCFFWFIANWSVNASLDFTSVASSTILASMSGFFTLGIGKLLRVEVFTLAKLGAVVTSFLGVLLVSLADSNQPPSDSSLPSMASLVLHAFTSDPNNHAPNPLLGDFLALISALFYALYVTLLKVRIKTESRIDMQLFFGFVGLFNVLTLWPVGILLHYMGWETLEWPSGEKTWAVIVINMLITLSSDYIYVLAMLKTTPLLVTIGLSLTIPFAVFGDITFLGMGVNGQSLIGAALVLVSFVAIGVEGGESEEDGPGDVPGGVEVPRTDRVGSVSTGRPRIKRGRSLTKVRLSFSRPEGEDEERTAFMRSHGSLREGVFVEDTVLERGATSTMRSMDVGVGASKRIQPPPLNLPST